MKQKIIFFVIIPILFSGFFIACGTVSEAITPNQQKSVDDFVVDKNDNGLTIVRYRGNEKIIRIPENINGLAVTAIGEEAFFEKHLTGVIIPDSITSIGFRAFADNNLTSVTIPNSVIFIDNMAFCLNRSGIIKMDNPMYDTSFVGWAITEKEISIDQASNRPTSITIAANIYITEDMGFDAKFIGAYIYNTRKAGTYKLQNRQWVLGK